jgi:hypothetical protein
MHLGDRRYSSYSFLTSALEGGEWSASRPGRALPPGKEPPVPTVQEAWWAPEPVWTQRLQEKSSAPVGDRTPAVQAVVRHCTDWATPAHVQIQGKSQLRIPEASVSWRGLTAHRERNYVVQYHKRKAENENLNKKFPSWIKF